MSRVTLFLLEWLLEEKISWQFSAGWLHVRAGQQKEPYVTRHPTWFSLCSAQLIQVYRLCLKLKRGKQSEAALNRPL